jgi:hypothetical protein
MSGGYIYKAVTMPPPDDAQAALNNLNFRVDDNMDVIATWVGRQTILLFITLTETMNSL